MQVSTLSGISEGCKMLRKDMSTDLPNKCKSTVRSSSYIRFNPLSYKIKVN